MHSEIWRRSMCYHLSTHFRLRLPAIVKQWTFGHTFIEFRVPFIHLFHAILSKKVKSSQIYQKHIRYHFLCRLKALLNSLPKSLYLFSIFV